MLLGTFEVPQRAEELRTLTVIIGKQFRIV
jgi:hypothetical protein